MTDADPPPDDPLAALLRTTETDVPPPDPAFLNELRARSLRAFEAAAPAAPAPAPPTEKRMTPFRWAAAATAALVLVGLAAAYWLATHRPAPELPDDNKFVIEEKLADDGRIGKVTDAQGVVAVRPVGAERWSPVQPRLALKPGDWLRTDARGAHAAAVTLAKAARVVVGPHSVVELVSPTEIRLLEGEVEITAPAAAPVELIGPGNEKVAVNGRGHFAVRKDKLARVEQEPLWLKGFKGTAVAESVGALIAKVDGRDVPLTVGYHHVTVDVRDQIARTTIEESFVNTTAEVLEGVFHFPLPADASISGFGMWIGDQLVEADVVEKQRAREIYEEILREKRDPGLLEWAGGNVFKARVYPIPGRSEKRIKITYTQVLPLQGNRYRYSYALQSELLKQHPLRDLKIAVTVNSAVALKGVGSPTHPARVSKTDHSGRVEFTAQEYTPTRDFEAVVEVEPGRPDVVVVPHRRGGDGYFMVQLTPPGAAADWERPLVPGGAPLKLLVVADTSASMDKAQRANQNLLLGALLGALTPKDTINVAACDVNCDWVFESSVPATPANVEAARKFVAERVSLGWTDLDKAFAAALKRTDPGTHVVYLGDAAHSTVTADPVAFADRLKRLYEGKAGTFHAVALGSTYESLALKAIGSLGGGSVRRVSADRTPQATAADLLTEIASPALRDVKVEFRGLRTARVYPEVLPNVPAGTQQILLGRYLPEGTDQSGEVVVTGTLAGKPVRYTSPVRLKDAEDGNSFVPRLWARMHLDHLLEQGPSATVKEQVTALSEEFHIITPYTSFLVLETDADRARFAVRRRFNMRDGEEFFREGQANAAFELRRKQMLLAGDYRTALRRDVLARLTALGRDTTRFHPRELDVMKSLSSADGRYVDLESPLGDADVYWGRAALGVEFAEVPAPPAAAPEPFALDGPGLDNRGEAQREPNQLVGDPMDGILGQRGVELHDLLTLNRPRPFAERITTADLTNSDFGLDDDLRMGFDLDVAGYAIIEGGKPRSRLGAFGRGYGGRAAPRLDWLGTLFPALPPTGRPAKESKSNWPPAAVELSRGLLRADALAKLKGGVVVAGTSETFNPVRGERVGRTTRLDLVSPTAWTSRTAPDGGQTLVSWCDPKERGVFGTAYQLGRVRPADKDDPKHPPLELGDYSVTPLHVAYSHMTPSVEAVAKDRALLVLRYPSNPEYEVRALIDTDRRVLVSIETRNKGKVSLQTRFTDPVEVGGRWWARRAETVDADGRRTALTTLAVTEVTADEFAKRTAAELAGKGKVLFLKQPLPSVADAKKAVAAGKSTFEDRAVLTLHFALSQQWARAGEHLEAAEKLAAGKAGLRWLRDSFLLASRRHEELRARLLAAAELVAAAADPDVRANDLYLADRVDYTAAQVLQADERLKLNDALRPVYERQPAHLGAAKRWGTRRVDLLESAGQTDAALRLAKELAAAHPTDHDLQYRYARALADGGDYPAAYAWLDRALAGQWEPHRADSLRDLYADLLRRQGRFRDLAAFLAKWVEAAPGSESVYARYLSALVRSNRAAEADALALRWMREARGEGELPPPVVARVRAAVNFALGQGYDLSASRIDEKWLPPLAELARVAGRRDDLLGLASQMLYSSRFSSTDAARAARKELAERLVTEIGTASPERVEALMPWVWQHDGTEADAWKAVAAALRKRWDAEKDPGRRHRLGDALERVLGWLGNDGWLAFLRVQAASGPAEYRHRYVHRLFDVLLDRPWTPANEDELFALLDRLAGPDEPAGGLATKVTALHRLTDALVEARYQARMKAVERPDQLPRPELQKKQEEARKAAQEGYADRLRKEAAARPEPLAAWVTAERVYLDVRADRELKNAAEVSWAMLTAPAPKADPDDDDAAVRARFDALLRDRALAVLFNLAARTGADPALAARLLAFLDGQAKDHPEQPRWRAEKFRLLLALDRTKELEAELTRWTAGPDPDSRWRVALGYLLAEQGRTADAIRQFEAVEGADELAPAAYRALAGWYQVENRRAEAEKAAAAAYHTAPEYQLNQRLNAYLAPWRSSSGPLPTAFDPEVYNLFRALFEKSATPGNYLWPLQQFYQASRDFQLLAMLADGVVGHSAAKVYPFLQGMGGVLGEVRDEATADRIVARVAEVRKAARTPVDHRALDLLELLVERRAAELQNQPGPHAEKALAALQRAFKRAWSDGEPRLMADFLAGLGAVPQPALAAEQLRQLEALHRAAARGSADRLHIAHRDAEALGGHTRRADAIDVLQAALKEYEEANGGVLPTAANNALLTLVAFYEAEGHYDRGEAFLLAQLKRPAHAEQKRWLTRRLNDLYHEALARKARVSLGDGATLYKALEKQLLAQLADADQNHRYDTIERLVRLYRTAFERKLGGAADDLTAFAFTRLPPVLREQFVNHETVVRTAAQALRDVVGPREALRFVLDRAADEPDWLRYADQDAWRQHSYRLGEWRAELKDLGDLEPRLLAFVLAELRRDLRSRSSRSRHLYDRRHSYFWPEQADRFARVAEEALDARKESGETAQYVAEYLFFGLGREGRAIEVLLTAHERKLLGERGRWQLADYLQRAKRFAESVPVLAALVAEHPENLVYRTRLMHAHFRTGRQAELLALLTQTDAFFHEKDRWTESALATLAASALENRLFEQAAAYYEELIPRHQRAHGRRPADGTLSEYYAGAARAYAGLGRTKEAADRAAGAVVAWGPRHEQRKEALKVLVEVLVAAPDLAAFAKSLDAEPLQSAVIRKAIGKAYLEKNDPARAVPQLQQAAELQPEDVETHDLLVASYDKLGDQAKAAEQLVQAVEASRRDLALYERLGHRYAELNRRADAERAFTSLAEVTPNESEGHAALAAVREKQGRWAEAVAHWERVAEVRALEPTGLLKLAAAQIEARAFDAARETLGKLRARAWPPRFTDVDRQTRELERKLDERLKK